MQQAIIRLVVLVVLLINQVLIVLGANPIPYSEEEIYEYVSSVALVLATLWSWWKNNNITKHAQEAQDYLDELKRNK